jgi:hypothetical protein
VQFINRLPKRIVTIELGPRRREVAPVKLTDAWVTTVAEAFDGYESGRQQVEDKWAELAPLLP